jgi:hypothetical protein
VCAGGTAWQWGLTPGCLTLWQYCSAAAAVAATFCCVFPFNHTAVCQLQQRSDARLFRMVMANIAAGCCCCSLLQLFCSWPCCVCPLQHGSDARLSDLVMHAIWPTCCGLNADLILPLLLLLLPLLLLISVFATLLWVAAAGF